MSLIKYIFYFTYLPDAALDSIIDFVGIRVYPEE